MKHHVPAELMNNRELNEDVRRLLPANYNFEINKSIWHIKMNQARTVALQFPEGLLIFAGPISRIIKKYFLFFYKKRYVDVDVFVMGDVAYGACCVDDYTASVFNADMIIHYGHSCLVPINDTVFCKVLYVFVDISFDQGHFIDTVLHNFDKKINKDTSVVFITTIQFAETLHASVKDIVERSENLKNCYIPQIKPLSRGEVLGCTSPILKENTSNIIFLGDGRFHIESLMIHYPHIPAFKYDPYSKLITREIFAMENLVVKQKAMIDEAKSLLKNDNNRFGIVLGTLGRQGSLKVFNALKKNFIESQKDRRLFFVLTSEVTPEILNQFENISVWTQIACPRLSIDWSESFHRPVLTSYEFSVVTGHAKWCDNNKYPMDYYAFESGGPWTPNHKPTVVLKKRAVN